jgi:predicted ATPase/DNA-binding SARP family transcriptional activator
MEQSDRLSFGILGSLEVSRGGERVEPRGAKLRALLLDLVVHRGRPRTSDQLIDALWGGAAPKTAPGVLHNYLSQLRGVLGPEVLTRTGSGYALVIDSELVDSERFAALAALAQQAERRGDADAVAELSTAARELWRGPALVEVADAEFAQPIITRLTALRATVDELHLHAKIEAGSVQEAIAELRERVVDDPARERWWWLLMLALYRDGRQSDALGAYHRARTSLIEAVGVEPGPALRALEAAILAHDPALERHPRAARTRQACALPTYRTALLGRGTDLDALAERVQANAVLTLTGVGGVGKTRLAVEFAARTRSHWLDGVAFLDLAAVSDPRLVPAAALAALGLDEEPVRPPLHTVTRALRERRMLVLVDNCEHVDEAARGLITAILHQAHHTGILATSRIPLGLPGEQVWPVQPLGTDDELADAVAMLTDRARALGVSLPLDDRTVALARCLGGLPLAIETIAPWTRTLSTQDILDRLGDLVSATDQREPTRQRTMTTALAWSGGHLDAGTRRLFHQFAVFIGAFDLAAAAAILDAGTDVLLALDDLVVHSLVIADTTRTPTRYRLLEPVRQYALTGLDDDGDATRLRQRHLDHYLGLAVQIGRHAIGTDATRWLAMANREIANLRTAHDWAIANGRSDDATVLAGGLYWYWWLRGASTEGIDRLTRSLSLEPSQRCAVRARIGLASLLIQAGHRDAAAHHAERALRDARSVGDPRLEAHALGTVGRVASDRQHTAEAEAALRGAQSLFEQVGNHLGVAWCQFVRYSNAATKSERANALPGLRRAHDHYAQAGSDWGLAWTHSLLGLDASRLPDLDTAHHHLDAANRLIDENGFRDELAVDTKAWLATVEARTDRPAGRRLVEQALAIATGLPDPMPRSACAWAIAELAIAADQLPPAARALGAVDEIGRQLAAANRMLDRDRVAHLTTLVVNGLGDDTARDLFRAGATALQTDTLHTCLPLC